MPLTSKSEWELVKDAKDNIIFYMAQVRVMNSKKSIDRKLEGRNHNRLYRKVLRFLHCPHCFYCSLKPRLLSGTLLFLPQMKQLRHQQEQVVLPSYMNLIIGGASDKRVVQETLPKGPYELSLRHIFFGIRLVWHSNMFPLSWSFNRTPVNLCQFSFCGPTPTRPFQRKELCNARNARTKDTLHGKCRVARINAHLSPSHHCMAIAWPSHGVGARLWLHWPGWPGPGCSFGNPFETLWNYYGIIWNTFQAYLESSTLISETKYQVCRFVTLIEHVDVDT